MPIKLNLDRMMLERRISLTDLAERVGITLANLSILKTNKARAVRFSTLEALCRELKCQPGDLLEYVDAPRMNQPFMNPFKIAHPMKFLTILLLLTAQLTIAAPPAEPPAATTNLAEKLTLLLNQRRYLEFEQTLNEAHDLAASDHDFFSGILANRKNQIAESLRALEPLLLKPQSASLTAEQGKLGWLILADDYTKSFQYGKAAEAYTHVLHEPATLLDEYEKKDISGARQIFELMKDYPAQTIKLNGPFTVQIQTNALGIIEIPVEFGGTNGPAIIDTGANLSTLSLTRARQLGLKISDATTPVAGMSGALSQCHVAPVPLLKIGKAEIHDVAVIVMDDKDLYYAPLHFQIDAVIGYPVIAALERVTFHSDGRLGISPSTNNPGAEMFMEELTPLVAANTKHGVRLFTLDTGASLTVLYDLYWNENQEDVAGVKPGVAQVQGAGGNREVPAVNAAEVPLGFGNATVVGHNISVLTKPHNTDLKEFFYGNIGQDLLRPLRSYSIDFQSMHFEIDPGTNH